MPLDLPGLQRVKLLTFYVVKELVTTIQTLLEFEIGRGEFDRSWTSKVGLALYIPGTAVARYIP